MSRKSFHLHKMIPRNLNEVTPFGGELSSRTSNDQLDYVKVT